MGQNGPAMHSPRESLLLLLLVSGWLCHARPVHACATCAVGDPTLTSMGAQQPFDGRVRAAAELMYRTERIGRTGVDRTDIREARLLSMLAYAPWRQLMLTLQVPVVARDVRLVNLAQERFAHLGDVELQARAYVYTDRALAPRHLLACVAGARLPSAPLRRSAGGQVEPELQTGTGSLTPVLGLTYAHFAGKWSVYAGELVYLPLAGRADFRAGAAWLGTHTLQYQVTPAWALRLGLNLRLDAPLRIAGVADPHGGGLALFAAPALLWSPATDLVIYLEANVPAVHATRGAHAEGTALTLGVALDV